MKTLDSVQRVGDIIHRNRRVSDACIAQELGISVGIDHFTVRQQLDYVFMIDSFFFELRTQEQGMRPPWNSFNIILQTAMIS